MYPIVITWLLLLFNKRRCNLFTNVRVVWLDVRGFGFKDISNKGFGSFEGYLCREARKCLRNQSEGFGVWRPNKLLVLLLGENCLYNRLLSGFIVLYVLSGLHLFEARTAILVLVEFAHVKLGFFQSIQGKVSSEIDYLVLLPLETRREQTGKVRE